MENTAWLCWCITSNAVSISCVPDLIAKLKMELTLQGKSLVLLKTKYIKLQLDFIFYQTKFAA
jgi:hypothetical protein